MRQGRRRSDIDVPEETQPGICRCFIEFVSAVLYHVSVSPSVRGVESTTAIVGGTYLDFWMVWRDAVPDQTVGSPEAVVEVYFQRGRMRS